MTLNEHGALGRAVSPSRKKNILLFSFFFFMLGGDRTSKTNILSPGHTLNVTVEVWDAYLQKERESTLPVLTGASLVAAVCHCIAQHSKLTRNGILAYYRWNGSFETCVGDSVPREMELGNKS